MATDDATTLRGTTFDAVIFLTKSKTTGDALAQLRPLLAGHPLLVTLQNGMGNVGVLPGELINAADLAAEIVADPMGAVWSKFVFNCVMNPLGALMTGDNATRHDSPEMRALIGDMAAECMAVVRALGSGLAFTPMEFVAQIRAGEMPLSKHAGSMALEIARGALTEIDELTGFIVRECERLNVPAPNCRAVYRPLKGLELAVQCRVANPQ